MNFIALDFETANQKRHSACSIALVVVQDNQLIGRYYSLIQPQTDFHWRNIQVHGITPEMVKDAPTFKEVWQDIEPLFQPEHLIVAHNAAFDNGVLRHTLAHHGLAQPYYQSLCTVTASRRLMPELENHKLNTLCQAIGIPLEHHHHALDDAIASAQILLHLNQYFPTSELEKTVKIIS
ncbi:3'-5' exonuclease [Vagococcus lutrae]|uniref:3'-5' exonuclease n=1 Tax=Vagococcus lutrae TaxID=81947 RepID=UPI002A823896|nr:3'-5' exonuclease [Vagococcus lutrae]MDY3706491.1 3'-5' exonuclease [Vagococcus lutrae]